VNFTVKDTLCVNDSVIVSNLSDAANSYHWNFCSANLSYAPEGQNIGNLGNLNGPAFTALLKDMNDNYYAFTTNHTDGTLTRMFIGNNLLNTPIATNLGNFGGIIPKHTEGIQIKYSNGNWLGFIVGGLAGESKLVRLNFGNSLSNTPTATDLGNIGNLSYPIDLYIFEENGSWIGFTANYNSNTITRFDFKSGLNAPPTAVNLGNIGNLSQPCGIMPVKSDRNWYFFISNFNTHSLTRLDFGTSLSNSPSGKNYTDLSGLKYPFDLSIVRDCGKYYGFLISRYGGSVRLDFPSGLENDPQPTNLGNVGGLSSPHGISDVYREGDTIYMYIANSANSTISRLYYPTCNAPTLFTWEQRNPPQFAYRWEGNFNIQLILNKGLPNEKALCKNVIVLPAPKTSLGRDTSFCEGQSIRLNAGGQFKKYEWFNGSSDSIFVADTTSSVWVEVTDIKGCKTRDTVNIETFPKTLSLGNDTILTRGESFTVDAGPNYLKYNWSTGEISQTITKNREGKYTVNVVDEHNCPQQDDIIIKYKTFIPNFITPNNDGFNDRWEIPLLANFPEAVIRIFDRFGKLIVELKGSDPSWDGTYNGKLLPKDSYWYFIDLKDGSEIIKGYFTLTW
jgi:gliding motility-associated-like protein